MSKKIALLLLIVISLAFGRSNRRAQRRSDEYLAQQCLEKYEEAIHSFNTDRPGRAQMRLSEVRESCINRIDHPDTIIFLLAETNFHTKKYSMAHHLYEEVINRYHRSPLREEAFFKSGVSLFNDAPIIERQDTQLREAQRKLSQFVNYYPTGPFSDTARVILDTIYERLVTKDIRNAHHYEIIKRYESAIVYYEHILQNFPNTNRADSIQLAISKNLILSNRFTEAEQRLSALEEKGVFKDEVRQLRNRKEAQKRELAGDRRRRQRRR